MPAIVFSFFNGIEIQECNCGQKGYDLLRSFSHQSPCDDSRQLQIWANYKSCSRLPSFQVIGPPFGGLDVLAPLLKLHPDFLNMITGNNATLGISFFNTDNYMKGLDW